MGQGCNHWLYWNWLRTNQCKKSWSAVPLEVPQKTQFNLFIQTINSSPYDTVFYLRHPPFPGKSCPDVCSSILNYYFLQWLLLFSSLPFFFHIITIKVWGLIAGATGPGIFTIFLTQLLHWLPFALTIERMNITLQCKFCPRLCKVSLLFWLSIYTNSSSLHWSTLFP